MTRTLSLHIAHSRDQRGMTLYVVLLLVLLATLAATWGARTSLFNQIIVSNDADYERAFEAAEAMLQDAELDIRMHIEDKQRCIMAGPSNENCSIIQFAQETRDLDILIDALSDAQHKCEYGICIKRSGAQDFWNDNRELDNLTRMGVGARYGQFTGAQSDASSSSAILAIVGNGQTGAWYWIEVMPYVDIAGADLIMGSSSARVLEISAEPYVAYRITAIAFGRKEGTRAVLQETYVDYRHNLNQPT